MSLLKYRCAVNEQGEINEVEIIDEQGIAHTYTAADDEAHDDEDEEEDDEEDEEDEFEEDGDDKDDDE